MSNVRQIHEQVKLPFSVALEVVLQGIRIRLGRSIVTILGVALGIAFLMSILTTVLIKSGVAAEDSTRNELTRMANFLTADTGALPDKTIVIVQTGALSSIENRFLGRLQEEKAVLRRVDAASPLAAAVKDASAVIVMGNGPAPAVDWPQLLDAARQKVLAYTSGKLEPQAGITVVGLSRELRAEEKAKLAVIAKRENYRSLWIIVVSLIVTVIGISNAMLMSVTERFREIGTMKCLGALSSFIRRLFLIESTLIGTMGALLGVLIGILFPMIASGRDYGFGMVFSSLNWGNLGLYALFSLVVGVVLSMVAAVYPARFASRMVPAAALRSNI